MANIETNAVSIVWGRRASDHFHQNERRRQRPQQPAATVRQDSALIAQVIATHAGLEQTRERRRDTPGHGAAAYAAMSAAPARSRVIASL